MYVNKDRRVVLWLTGSQKNGLRDTKKIKTDVNNINNNNKNIQNNAYVNKDRRAGLWLTGSQRNGLGDTIREETKSCARPDQITTC